MYFYDSNSLDHYIFQKTDEMEVMQGKQQIAVHPTVSHSISMLGL